MNQEFAQDLCAFIEELPEERFNMEEWCSFSDGFAAMSAETLLNPSCHTAGCIAGSAVALGILQGLVIAVPGQYNSNHYLAELQSGTLTFSHIELAAQWLLGINQKQADELFTASGPAWYEANPHMDIEQGRFPLSKETTRQEAINVIKYVKEKWNEDHGEDRGHPLREHPVTSDW